MHSAVSISQNKRSNLNNRDIWLFSGGSVRETLLKNSSFQGRLCGMQGGSWRKGKEVKWHMWDLRIMFDALHYREIKTPFWM